MNGDDADIRESLTNVRTDVGAFWENSVIAERVKMLRYKNIDVTHYFWRIT
jgi:uncharacterized protein